MVWYGGWVGGAFNEHTQKKSGNTDLLLLLLLLLLLGQLLLLALHAGVHLLGHDVEELPVSKKGFEVWVVGRKRRVSYRQWGLWAETGHKRQSRAPVAPPTLQNH
jgi:hypothetical protein